ncbi:hypothetical protein D1B33_04770 [Lysinibacillus yapensis]|uniref:Uncharacterized protein n=1 Tax=Ureibacillus yapensis TaxID=2304605 RepID=A0A396SHL5_9BACL|nr:hypothetical protein [Lysinibacillus yapensis]RHW38205.1 hypothetical protein D1B33_04770 [Lysinibacillus yapensis]
MNTFFLMDDHDRGLYSDLMNEASERMNYYTIFYDQLLDIEKRKVQSELENIMYDIERLKLRAEELALPMSHSIA